MIMPIAAAARPVVQIPPMPPLAIADRAVSIRISNEPDLFRLLQDIQGGRDQDIFIQPENDEPFHPAVRNRRASLRPQVELLGIYTTIGRSTVGGALKTYGRTLWDIRQGLSSRQGIAQRIRADGVAALGGRNTARGREFMRRCQLVSRFTIHLERMQKQAVASFPKIHAHLVKQEIQKFLTTGLHYLASGKNYDDATRANIRRAIECRIQREETNWLTFPFFWVWSKFWC